ncbi:MAG: hypothetical protein M1832_000159 [Thelocarpon impressellum]|nr:MAG: hypothetical protein M1832_000159 [Thelocarpon impressellum]
MKEAIIHPDLRTELIDSPVPKPGADQVVIKVAVSGSNPKDWKYAGKAGKPTNQGDDIAGVVESVGEEVSEFKAGDRVAAFHELFAPNGSYAEYAVSQAHTTFHLPKKTSYEEAATIPLAAMTSALALWVRLGLPEPFRPATKPIPLIIYGGASAVGAFAIKLASLANIHPLIVVAGRGQEYVRSLIDESKGDSIVDYRKGDEAVVSGIKDALRKTGNDKVEFALDAVAEHGTARNIAMVLDAHGRLTLVLPLEKDSGIPDTVETTWTYVATVHGDDQDFGSAFFRLFGRWLQQGRFSGHPYEAVPGGLAGVQKGLHDLKAGKASANKYVFRISDTPGVGA